MKDRKSQFEQKTNVVVVVIVVVVAIAVITGTISGVYFIPRKLGFSDWLSR